MHGLFSEKLVFFLRSGDYFVSSLAIVAFKLAFSVSLLLKHLVEVSRGYPAHVEPGTFAYETRIASRAGTRIAGVAYRYLFRFRPILITLFAVGVVPQFASAVLAASYIAEVAVYFRYHAMVAAIVSLVLALDAQLTNTSNLIWAARNWTSEGFTATINAPGALFVQTLILVIYAASAWRKIQRRFFDGSVIRYGAKFSATAGGRRYPDHIFAWTKEWVAIAGRYARTISSVTIVVEIVLVVLFLGNRQCVVAACCLGLLFHAGATLLFPVTLCFFSIMSISTYMLWLF